MIRIELVHPLAKIPSRATPGSSGYDLYSVDDLTIYPSMRRTVSTGLRVQIPMGFEGQIRPRSGLAFAHGLTVLNSPGTIDSDFRGVVQVILVNHGQSPVSISAGDRIAQIVLARVESMDWIVAELDETERAHRGFGSTGA
jgi:dUTP pyrophosphatase